MQVERERELSGGLTQRYTVAFQRLSFRNAPSEEATLATSSSALNRYTHFLMAQGEPSFCGHPTQTTSVPTADTSRLVCKDMRQLKQCKQSARIVWSWSWSFFLRPTGSRPVVWVSGLPLGPMTRFVFLFFFGLTITFILFPMASSLTRKWVCSLECLHSLVRSLNDQ
jgi:hypothetical protein